MSGETRLSFLVDLNAKEATAAAKQLKGEVDKLTAGAKKSGEEAGRARDGLGRFAKGAQEAAKGAEELATAAEEVATSTEKVGQKMPVIVPTTKQFGEEATKAARSGGMMAAQLNDIVMQAAAGQAPMMIAIQQGSAITQNFGQAGAAGALAQLKAGFATMLTPLNLATYAIITFGSTALQWLVAASGGAEDFLKSFSDATDQIEASLSSLRSNGVASLEELRKKYGEVDQQLLMLLRHQREQALADGQTAARDAVKALADEYGLATGQLNIYRITGQGAGADVAKALNLSKDATIGFLQAIKDASSATTLDQQAEALARVDGYLRRSSIDGSDAAMAITDAALRIRELATAAVDGDRLLTGSLTAAVKYADGLAKWLGEGLSAFSQLGQTDGASAISAATGPANRLAEILRAAAGWWASIGKASQDVYQTSDGRLGRRSQLYAPMTGRGLDTSKLYAPPADDGKDKGSGGGGGKAADATGDLIAKYQEELAVLRELDPIQKILLGNHEALAGATAEERARLTELVAEKARLETIQQKLTQIGSLGKNAFLGLASGALTFRSALANVLDGLAQMAASAAWDLLWSGGGGKKKGGGGLGGFIGSLLGLADGGMVPGNGGPRADDVLMWGSSGEYMVNAEATRRNLPLVEAINAGANPRQLAAVVAAMMPRMPAYADGGMVGIRSAARAMSVGSAAPASWSRAAPQGAGAQELALTVNVEGARGNAEVAEMVEKGVKAGIEAFSRNGLPTRVRQISAAPRRMS